MTIRETYVLFAITVLMIFVLSPAVDLARERQGRQPIYPAISAILPSSPLGLPVAICYAGIGAGCLTYGVRCLRRILPGVSVWLATMLFLAPLFGGWLLLPFLFGG